MTVPACGGLHRGTDARAEIAIEPGDRGLAGVAAPEEILNESTVVRMAGVEVSLDRVGAPRAARDGVTASQSFGASQRVFPEQWQQPELHHNFCPHPVRQATGVTGGSRSRAGEKGEAPEAVRRSFAFSGKRRLSISI